MGRLSGGQWAGRASLPAQRGARADPARAPWAPLPPRPPPGALCFPLDLELGSRLPMCRQPWGRASGSVRLAGRGHVSGDATLFLGLTPGSRPTLHAASREGERVGVPRVPLLTHAAGGALHTCSPARALPAPDVWGSLLLDGSPAGAVWLCLGPSPGGRRGGCCLRTTPRASCVCVTRVEVHLQHSSQGRSRRSGLSARPFAQSGQTPFRGWHQSADHRSLSFSKPTSEQQCLKWLNFVPPSEGLVCKLFSPVHFPLNSGPSPLAS